MSLSRRLLAGGLAALAVGGTACAVGRARDTARWPIVIAHRGAGAYRPEETAHAYEPTIAMGADLIEPDVVSTKDHVLVARHDNWLNDTTDVASRPEFAGVKATKTVDGVKHNDRFTEDFTFAQLETLRTRSTRTATRARRRPSYVTRTGPVWPCTPGAYGRRTSSCPWNTGEVRSQRSRATAPGCSRTSSASAWTGSSPTMRRRRSRLATTFSAVD